MNLNFLSIFFLPFFSSVLLFLYGRFLSFFGCFLLSIFSLLFGFITVLFFAFQLFKNQTVFFFNTFFWIENFFIQIPISFLFDFFSISMCLLILFISIMVQLYSVGYMATDRNKVSFLAYLNFSTSPMLVFVSSNSSILTFFGREGVGLISFFLISFWSSRNTAAKAGLKALLLNKIGDSFSLIAFPMLYDHLENFTISILLKQISEVFFDNFFSPNLDFTFSTITASFILMAALVKSAQIFLHLWLADAMEGPTPVSALLHAATMVTAGVFSIIRFSNLVENSKIILSFSSLISLITLVFASILSSFQEDVKKIIAFSTCAQLSIMFISRSFSSYSLAMFHLINHAFYKAFSFLLFGIIIHLSLNQQDLDSTTSAAINFSFINIFSIFGNLSLMAIPPFSGYFSKDLVLDFTLSNNTIWFYDFSYTLVLLSIFSSTCYSVRLAFEGLLQIPVGEKVFSGYKHRISNFMVFPVLLLGFFSIFFGFFYEEVLTFSVKFDEILAFTSSNSFSTLFEDIEETFSIFDEIFILFLVFSAIFLSWLFVIIKPQLILTNFNFSHSYNLVLNKKWGFDFFLNFFSTTFYKYSFLGLFRNWGSWYFWISYNFSTFKFIFFFFSNFSKFSSWFFEKFNKFFLNKFFFFIFKLFYLFIPHN